MAAAAHLFRAVLDGNISPEDGVAGLQSLRPDLPFCNGFYHGAPGHAWL